MINLMFSHQPDIASDLIAWFSQGKFSHVDAITPEGRLLGARSDEVGGKPAGVYIRPPDYANFDLRVVFQVPSIPAQEDCFNAFLRDQIGKPYDNLAIMGFLSDRDWRSPDKWFCSELIAAALESAGIFNRLYLATWKITPVSLSLAVSAIGAIVK